MTAASVTASQRLWRERERGGGGVVVNFSVCVNVVFADMVPIHEKRERERIK